MIRLSKSSLSRLEKSAVMSVLAEEYLGMGSFVKKFEELLTEYFGRDTVCVSSGTAALHLALEACDLDSESEVLLPSLTYVASFQAVTASGAIPVSCDVNEKTFQLDLLDAEKRLTSKTKVLMPVYFAGAAPHIREYIDFCALNGLTLIADAAHAFGSSHKNERIGSFGGTSCFSFDGIKNITCGEGGCIVSDDADLLNRVKTARLLGVENDTEKRLAGERSWDFDVTRQGWRYHMNNISAAIGIEQLKRFEYFSQKRQSLAEEYNKQLSLLSKFVLLPSNYREVVPHIYPIRIIGLQSRNALRKKLLDVGIETGVHYFPNHLHTFFASDETKHLPVTEDVFGEMLTLPLHVDMGKKEVRYICQKLFEFCS